MQITPQLIDTIEKWLAKSHQTQKKINQALKSWQKAAQCYMYISSPPDITTENRIFQK